MMTDTAENPRATPRPAITMIGFGEAARAFVSGWREVGQQAQIAAFDIKTNGAGKDAMQAQYRAHGVIGCADPAGAVQGAALVFSLVTADQAAGAAQEVAAVISPGAFYLDANSCAPGTKRRNAAVVEAVGGRYVDVAIMAPVQPRKHRTPMLLSGPHATALVPVLADLGMTVRLVSGPVGHASSIKMVRSIMVKGLEALMAECLLAGQRAGVSAEVLDSLEASDPEFGWRRRGSYNLERMMRHGQRRAAEMDEVARMLDELDLPQGMARATADWQRRIAGLGLDSGADDLKERTGRVLAALMGEALDRS